MAESAVAALGFGRFFDDLEDGAGHGADDQLGNSIASAYGKGVLAKVHQDDADDAAIVGVDGPRSIGQNDALAQGQTASGANLAFVSGGDGDSKSGRDQFALARIKGHIVIDGRVKIHAGGPFGLVLGQGKVGAVGFGLDFDFDWGGVHDATSIDDGMGRVCLLSGGSREFFFRDNFKRGIVCGWRCPSKPIRDIGGDTPGFRPPLGGRVAAHRDGKNRLDLSLTRQDIASMVGAMVESAIRTMSRI